MLRWGKGFACVVAITTVAIAMSCAPAFAAPTKGARSLAVNDRSVFLTAFDGQDVYWVTSKRVSFKHGETTVESVYRSSFNENGAVLVYRTQPKSFDSIYMIKAGGGVAAIGVYHPQLRKGELRSDSIVRVNRDGTSAQEVAAGLVQADDEHLAVVENGVARLNDCGTDTELNAVSSTGEVFYTRRDRERGSTACGGKPDVNQIHYVGVAINGATREIYSGTEKVVSHFRVTKYGGKPFGYCECDGSSGDFDVFGEYAVLSPDFRNYSVINMTTGAVLPIPAMPKGDSGSRILSVTTSGKIVQNQAVRSRYHRPRYQYFTTIYPTPGSLQPEVKTKGAAWTLACGDAIFSVFERRKKEVIVQVDPLTGALTRVVATVSSKNREGVIGCTAGFMYAVKERRGKQIFTLLPLG
ncbi:MAG: hypothetical protein ACRDKI_04135 [Solirubrobacterales bacterium]